MSHISVSPVRGTIKRIWTDVSRKVVAFAATGLTATALLAFLNYLGISIPESLASLIVVVVSALAGYLKSDVLKPGAIVVVDPTPAQE